MGFNMFIVSDCPPIHIQKNSYEHKREREGEIRYDGNRYIYCVRLSALSHTEKKLRTKKGERERDTI